MSEWRNWGGNVTRGPGAGASTSARSQGVADAVQRAAVDRAAGAGRPGRATRSPRSSRPTACCCTSTGSAACSGSTATGAGCGCSPAPRCTCSTRRCSRLGLALPNLGDIDRQTISGAIATGTHGTGTRRQGIARRGQRAHPGAGRRVDAECSAEVEPEVFAAARVGLGALGVVTEVELQCVPAYRLHARGGRSLAHRAAARHPGRGRRHRPPRPALVPAHRPGAHQAQRRRRGRRGPAAAATVARHGSTTTCSPTGVFELANRLGRRPSDAGARASTGSARGPSARREYADDSWKVFCSAREVRFVESEYAVPRRRGRGGAHRAARVVRPHRRARAVPGGGALHRRRRRVAVDGPRARQRLRRGAPVPPDGPATAFAAFESIVAEHEGRPHWGKVHTLGAERLRELYPRFDDFRAVRERLDPGHLFTNDHVAHLLDG